MGEGSKGKKIEKIGRFGVGFNTVYHLTDCPMFVSNNEEFVIFDPTCSYLDGINALEPGCRISDIKNNMQGLFDDVLEGFNFGMNLENENKACLSNSTMFRFPIRSHRSNLSNTHYKVEEIEHMINEYISSNKNSLLFLRNIQKISFLKVKNGESDSVNLECFHSEQLKYENGSTKRNNHFNNLEIESKFCDIKPNLNDYELTIEIHQPNKPIAQNKFFLFEQTGFDCENEKEIELVKQLQNEKEKLNIPKYYPSGGIAFESNVLGAKSFKNKDYKIFNNLPLEQNSPLPVHINAYWALSKENRTQIFEYAEKYKDNAEKDRTNWNIQYNLALFNNIILSCYLRLFNRLKFAGVSKTNMEYFIKNTKHLFPDKPEGQKEGYFQEMAKIFYQKILNVECIPIIDIYNKESVKWFRPKDILFTSKFESFLKNNDYEEQIDLICSILAKSGINICRSKKIFDKFKREDKTSLNELTGSFIVEHFKQTNKVECGVNINETLFENVNNLKAILKFCKEEENFYKIIEGSALLVSNDQILRRFSLDQKLFLFDDPSIFKNNGDQFLSTDLKEIFEEDEIEYFESIKIEDLNLLLPSALDKRLYCDSNLPILEIVDKSIIQKVWHIILKNIGPNSNKNEKIHLLEPIKTWSLIPVQSNKEILKTCLSKIEESGNIIVDSMLRTKFNFLSFIGAPVFKDYVLDSITNDFLKSITNNLNENEDILKTFEKKKKILSTLSREELKSIRELFDSLLIRIYNRNSSYYSFKKSDQSSNSNEVDIKNTIKSLPIFENILTQADCISNKKVYLICSYPTDGLDLFCDQNDIFLIQSTDLSTKMVEYLAIESISRKDLYSKFLSWASQFNQVDFLKSHLNFIQNDSSLNNDDQIVQLLSQIPFVNVNGMYKKVKECYSRENKIFLVCYSNLILPDEYNIHYELMLKLGLKTKIQDDEILETALKLRQMFYANTIKIENLEKLSMPSRIFIMLPSGRIFKTKIRKCLIVWYR